MDKKIEVEDWSLVNAVGKDQSPLAVNQRVKIMTAMFRVAREHHGLIHASWVREYLPEGEVNDSLIGNVASQLSRAHITERTGDYLPSAQTKNRNKTKDLPVRRVTDWHRFVDALMEMK